MKVMAIQFWALAFLPCPHFLTDWIVDDAYHDLAAETQRNRHAKMRNAVEIIDGAIKWIDDPLMLAGLIANDPFFAVKHVLRKFFQKQFCN